MSLRITRLRLARNDRKGGLTGTRVSEDRKQKKTKGLYQNDTALK